MLIIPFSPISIHIPFNFYFIPTPLQRYAKSHPQQLVSYPLLKYTIPSFQMSCFERNMCFGITVHTPTLCFLWRDDSLFQMLALPQVSDERELELEYEGANYKRWVMTVDLHPDTPSSVERTDLKKPISTCLSSGKNASPS